MPRSNSEPYISAACFPVGTFTILPLCPTDKDAGKTLSVLVRQESPPTVSLLRRRKSKAFFTRELGNAAGRTKSAVLETFKRRVMNLDRPYRKIENCS